ncbi:hypothetical protein ABZT06_50275 [Streptomyces sp. NPDC005483]|uniref:hypothetical protein n=1 Tax=Streptomyces sp. NPDC005483 TaxID=3154882 RepID=UPI0033B19497
MGEGLLERILQLVLRQGGEQGFLSQDLQQPFPQLGALGGQDRGWQTCKVRETSGAGTRAGGRPRVVTS